MQSHLVVFIISFFFCFFFFFKQKTAYEMRISDWSSDVCSSDLLETLVELRKIRFVRAEEEHQLRRGRDHIGDAALLRIAEHQPPHPRRAHMDDVEAIPHPEIGRASCRERVCQYE